MPEADALALIRRNIDRRPDRLKQALKTPGIRKEFLDGVEEDDSEIVSKFIAHNKENALKTKPKVSDSVSYACNLMCDTVYRPHARASPISSSR
jgi:hypothetical protein